MGIKRHTPSMESVWAEWERAKRMEKWRAGRKPRIGRRILDNSEPWLPHPPRTIADLVAISDCVARAEIECQQQLRRL
jgi:hypothetical protein